MKFYAGLVYLFLYIPIAIIVIFSFNAGRHATQMTGFSWKWYGRALNNPFVIDALTTSLITAFVSAVFASLFGTMAAIALQAIRGKIRILFDALIYIAVMVPGIVIGIATLIALVTFFKAVNPWLASLIPGTEIKLQMGYISLIASHTLFTMSLVIIIVRTRMEGMDRSLIEASYDLNAPPLSTFFQITLPMISPAILAGFLLSFTFSFDDFIISFFVAGSETTIPIYIFSSIRRGVTPEINAIGSMVLVISLVLLIIAQIFLHQGERNLKK